MNNLKGTFIVLFCGISLAVFSQNIGINTTGATPSSNAILDLNTGNAKSLGLIIPRVVLGASLSTFTPPMANAATGLDSGIMVYNWKATNQSVGYYYWSGSTWVSVTGAGGGGWQLTGNAGTTPGTNYIGTSDGEALEFKANAQKSGWIDYSSNPGNTALGYQTLNSNSGSLYNTAMGYQSLYSVQYNSADSNTASGYQSLYTNQGNANTAVGFQALYNNAYSAGNTALGSMALYNESSGVYNTAVGYKALYNNPSGKYNTAMGYEALYNGTNNGTQNVAIGSLALYNGNSPTNDIAIGNQALYSNTSGQYNIAAGYQSLYSSVSGQYNVSLGYQSLYNDPSSYCIALGYQALYGTSGQYAANSIALGYQALYSVTYGSYNLGIGDSALYHTTGGGGNVAMGQRTLLANTTGAANVAMGYQTLQTNTSGSNNVAIGYQALQTNSTGSNNTAIGNGANVSASGLSNATAIGNGATVAASNTAMIGNSNITTVSIGAGAYVVPVQDNTATSGTVASNGSQVLNLTGNASSLTLTPPASPINGQQWEVTTNQSSINITWSGNFVNAPSTVKSSVPARFFYDTSISKWVTM